MEAKDGLILSFKGSLTPEKLSQLIELGEARVCGIEPDKFLAKKVVWILIEVLQNLLLHGKATATKQLTEEESAVDVALEHSGPSYTLTSRNYLTKAEADQFRVLLREVNALSTVELRELSKTRLLDGRLSEHGSARLGLIGIARRSTDGLAFSLEECGEDLYSFQLRAKVERLPLGSGR